MHGLANQSTGAICEALLTNQTAADLLTEKTKSTIYRHTDVSHLLCRWSLSSSQGGRIV